MKKVKGLLAGVMVLIFAFGLTACAGSGAENTSGNTTAAPTQTDKESAGDSVAATEGAVAQDTAAAPVTGSKSSHLDGGTDPLHIAFIIYSWTDDQGTYIQQYGDYLQENFNVEFEYVSARNTAEETIDAVESLCSKGVDGIITANTHGFQSWSAICEEYGVWYSIMLGQLDDADDQEYAKTCSHYLGSLGNYDYSFLGEEYAAFTIGKGYENVLVAGPATGASTQSDQMIAAYTAALDKNGVTYKVLQTSFTELFTAIAAELAANTYDMIYCPLSMMNFAVANIYANNLVGKTQTMGHGFSEDLGDALDAGVVAMFSDNMTTDVGVNFALIANAVEGNKYPDWPSGECVNISAPTFIIKSDEDYQVYTEHVRNYEDNPFLCNVDQVKNMIMSYNGTAAFDGIKTYIETMSIDKLKETN